MVLGEGGPGLQGVALPEGDRDEEEQAGQGAGGAGAHGEGGAGERQTAGWLRRFVRELEGQAQGERRLQRLLFFVTSLTSIPSCGLRRKITVEVEAAAGAASSAAALPVASTCFYTLSLPCYASFAELAAKMELAFANSNGFGLQ
jgi:hypothetical protein